MRILLTGGAGYVGSAVMRRLVRDNHQVIVPVRPGLGPGVTRAGGLPVVGDLTESDWLAGLVEDADAVVHAAAPAAGESAEDLDRAVLDVVLPTLAGTRRPYVHTSVARIHGAGRGITEQTPFAPVPADAWRPAVVDRVRGAAEDDIRTVVVAPGTVYGHRGGLLMQLLDSPVTGNALRFPAGDGYLSVVHVDDLASLFVIALMAGAPGSYVLGAGPGDVSLAELGGMVSVACGLGGRVAPEEPDATRRRLGAAADALFADQRIDASFAAAMGWRPSAPSLLEELVRGSYAAGSGG